ncbi:BF3164 family lipoprotein [Algoriphagus halophilus]|uniref:TolB-like 6-blade propeller-like n=1 Tax=Algoriphagus halophilus TaxID=226505 RepID=A0A1N6DIB2_9BACT|nr:BF3164 family lipoprotein [Algoriphagus halophilus]SIN70498.1 TolB-like 6-blade propeller-like [Algoriphagus halophilus]
MKIKFFLFILHTILLGSVSCSDREEVIEIVELKSKKFYFEEIKIPMLIQSKKGKLVVSEHPRIAPGLPLLHVVNGGDMTYEFSHGKVGFGPGELSDVSGFDLGSNDSTFWVYSAMEKRISEFSLFESSDLAKDQIKQPENFFKATDCLFLTDSTFLGMFVDSPHRLVEFGFDNDFEKGYGTLENFTARNDLDNYNLSQINSGWFRSNEDKSIFAIACIYYDKLEVFNSKTKEFKTIYGPDLEVFDFEVKYKTSGPSLLFPWEAPYQYRDIAITNDRIYALYGGISEPEISQTSEIARIIRVYDLDGNLLELYHLDRSLRSIELDIENEKIYGITTDSDPGIAFFKLP